MLNNFIEKMKKEKIKNEKRNNNLFETNKKLLENTNKFYNENKLKI